MNLIFIDFYGTIQIMEDKEILTDEEKRFLWLSAKDKLALPEELEYTRLKKDLNHKQMRTSEKHAFNTGCLSVLFLSTTFMPAFVLPTVTCLLCLGYLAYMERSYFPKVRAKAYYYFNVLNSKSCDTEYQKKLITACQETFDHSKNISSRIKSVEKLKRFLDKVDQDRKKGVAYELINEYKSLPRFRMEILAASGVFLTAGFLLPQTFFLCGVIGMTGLSSLLSYLDAKTMKTERYAFWAQKEEKLKAELQNKMRAFENQPILDTQNQLKKISHKERVKSDNTRQRDD